VKGWMIRLLAAGLISFLAFGLYATVLQERSSCKELRGASQRLLAKLDEIEASGDWHDVWTVFSVHGYTYRGPNMLPEVTDLKAAVKRPC